MKLREMLISMRQYTPPTQQQVIVNPKVETPSVDMHTIEETIKAGTNDTINALMEFMKQPNVTQISQEEAETELDDDEVNEIQAAISDLEEKLFGDTPIDWNVSKSFIYNIPKNVFKAHQDCIEYDRPVVLDPLIFLYAMLTEDPRYTMGSFLKKLMELCEEFKHEISADAEEWEKYNSEEE